MSKTKAEIEKELKVCKNTNERIQKEIKTLERLHKDIATSEQEARTKLRLYQNRYGVNISKKKTHTITIGQHTLYREKFENAIDTVKKLLDAGVWYFSVSEK